MHLFRCSFQGPDGQSDSGAILGPLIQVAAPVIGPILGPLIGPLSRTISGVRIFFHGKPVRSERPDGCKNDVNLIFRPEDRKDPRL